MQRARYQEQRRADRWDSDNLTRKEREYYRERQRLKRRKEKRRRRIRSIVSSLEGIFLCLILIAALNYLPVFGNQGQTGRLADAFGQAFPPKRNGAEAGLIWGEERTEAALEESEEILSETEAEIKEPEESLSETEMEETKAEEMTAEAGTESQKGETQSGESQPQADQPGEPEAGNYDFSRPVPLSAPVDNSYFDDAVFIGDSRTEGLITNTGLSNTTAYTYKGLMVDTVFTKPVIRRGENKVSVMDALKTTSFSKIYIMFGINENGWPYNDVFIDRYEKIIDAVREINPDAVIYVQEIMPVTNQVSASHSYIRNGKIAEFNRLLRQMAKEKQVYFIDTASAVAASDGSLPADAASDGIHLKKDYCKKWLDYLKSHTAAAH